MLVAQCVAGFPVERFAAAPDQYQQHNNLRNDPMARLSPDALTTLAVDSLRRAGALPATAESTARALVYAIPPRKRRSWRIAARRC
jgi:(2R)-3-sulfolactate dehydrogenase (NADP+)